MPLPRPTGAADRPTLTTATSESPGQEATCNAAVEHPRGWLGQIESVIERYPWPTLLLALGIGYALSRRMRMR
jgi:hypothetical protein